MKRLDQINHSRLVEMAWEDRTTFDQIEKEYGMTESDVIHYMRKFMKNSSFKMWRKRVSSRSTKHDASFSRKRYRAHATIQYKYKQNRK